MGGIMLCSVFPCNYIFRASEYLSNVFSSRFFREGSALDKVGKF